MLFIGIHVGNCQASDNNFLIERSSVVWRKTFETPLSQGQLCSRIRESGVMTHVEQLENNRLIGELREIDPDYVGAGYTFLTSPGYLNDCFLNGFVLIEVKEGRYRVTVKKITMTKKRVDSLHITGAKAFIEEEALRFEKKEMTPSFIKNGSKILDHTFTQLFGFNEMVSDEW
jgi:hypothetical protein